MRVALTVPVLVVILHEIAERALAQAEEKVRGENLVRVALQAGMSTREAFKKYGIL